MSDRHNNCVRPTRVLAMLIAASLAGCAAQQLHYEGQRQIRAGHPEQGLEKLRQASLLETDNLQYRLDYMNRLNAETIQLIQRGEAHRLAGDLDAARSDFLAVLHLDQSNERGRRGLTDVEQDGRHAEMLRQAEKLVEAGKLDAAKERINAVLLSDPSNKPAKLAARRIDDQQATEHRDRQAAIENQSILKKPVTLQFRDANLRMVFEALSRTTGLNVIFDRDVRADLKTTIFVQNGSIGDTVDLILLQSQLEKKILNANTMFIYPAVAAKQKEYQELKIRTFQVSNGDAKYIQGMLKNVLKIKEVQVDEHTNTLVLRDTPEALAVAARVIAAHDLPEAEVMLEVQVLEVSRDRLSDLGIAWPDNMTLSTPTTADGAPLSLGMLKHVTANSLLTTPLQAGLNLKLQDTDANLLASPRIRVREHEKAKILIGDKVPIITNTVTPVSTGTPVITGSVQYIDVGIKLEAEPQVYAEGDVGIKLNLEVSNIVKEIAGPGGSLAYQIGTRMVSTSLRLHDGETQVLGGLISDSDRNSSAKVPGIGQLPLLGRLFSNNNGDRTKTEVVLSITPRILRAKGIAEDTMADVWSGTEGAIREAPLRLDPISSVNLGDSSQVANVPAPSQAAPQPVFANQSEPASPANSSAPGNSVLALAPSGLAVTSRDQPANVPVSPLSQETRNVLTVMTGSAGDTVKAVAPNTDGGNGAGAVSPKAGLPAGAPVALALAMETVGAMPAGGPRITLNSPDNIKVGDRFAVAVSGENFNEVHVLPLSVQYDGAVLTFVGATLGEFSDRAHAAIVEPSINQAAGRASVLLKAEASASFAGSGTLLNLNFVAKLSRKNTQVSVVKGASDDGHSSTIPRPAPLTLAVEP